MTNSITTIGILLVGIAVGGGLGALLGHFGRCSSGACPLTANPRRGAMVGMLLGALIAASFGCERPQTPAAAKIASPTPSPAAAVAAGEPAAAPAATATAPAAPVHIADAAEFTSAVLQAQLPVLVDFHATWCPPCKQLAPVLEKLAGDMQGQLLIAKVDVDKLSELASRYGVQSIPHMILFKDGDKVASRTGFGPGGEADLKKWLQEYL